MRQLSHYIFSLLLTAAMAVGLASCRIEPPLHLPGQDVDVRMAEVQVDINVVWDIEADWQSEWYYGWDQVDLERWGEIAYPDPRIYNVRHYFKGADGTIDRGTVTPITVFGNSFTHRFNFGWHDLLFWSDVITYDGTQSVVIDESDPYDVHATTTNTNLSFRLPGARTSRVYNNPEIFYSGIEEKFRLTEDPADYDYFDSQRQVWVKHLQSHAYPMVYIYLVQVIVYNNNDRIVGLNDRVAMTSLSDGVSLHRGETHNTDITVAFDMRMKKDLEARGGRHADIFGTKFTTFGLCGMPSWEKNRGAQYVGSRPELSNNLAIDFLFHNANDTTYTFDVTPQLQRQSHGGVITIEIDADTLHIPVTPSEQKGTGFVPTVENFADTTIYVLPM